MSGPARSQSSTQRAPSTSADAASSSGAPELADHGSNAARQQALRRRFQITLSTPQGDGSTDVKARTDDARGTQGLAEGMPVATRGGRTGSLTEVRPDSVLAALEAAPQVDDTDPELLVNPGGTRLLDTSSAPDPEPDDPEEQAAVDLSATTVGGRRNVFPKSERDNPDKTTRSFKARVAASDGAFVLTGKLFVKKPNYFTDTGRGAHEEPAQDIHFRGLDRVKTRLSGDRSRNVGFEVLDQPIEAGFGPTTDWSSDFELALDDTALKPAPKRAIDGFALQLRSSDLEDVRLTWTPTTAEQTGFGNDEGIVERARVLGKDTAFDLVDESRVTLDGERVKGLETQIEASSTVGQVSASVDLDGELQAPEGAPVPDDLAGELFGPAELDASGFTLPIGGQALRLDWPSDLSAGFGATARLRGRADLPPIETAGGLLQVSKRDVQVLAKVATPAEPGEQDLAHGTVSGDFLGEELPLDLYRDAAAVDDRKVRQAASTDVKLRRDTVSARASAQTARGAFEGAVTAEISGRGSYEGITGTKRDERRAQAREVIAGHLLTPQAAVADWDGAFLSWTVLGKTLEHELSPSALQAAGRPTLDATFKLDGPLLFGLSSLDDGAEVWVETRLTLPSPSPDAPAPDPASVSRDARNYGVSLDGKTAAFALREQGRNVDRRDGEAQVVDEAALEGLRAFYERWKSSDAIDHISKVATEEGRYDFLAFMRPHFGTDQATVAHFQGIDTISGTKIALHHKARTRVEEAMSASGLKLDSTNSTQLRTDLDHGGQTHNMKHNIGFAVDFKAVDNPHHKRDAGNALFEAVTGGTTTVRQDTAKDFQGQVRAMGRGELDQEDEDSVIKAFGQALRALQARSDAFQQSLGPDAAEEITTLRSLYRQGEDAEVQARLKELVQPWFDRVETVREQVDNAERQALLTELVEGTSDNGGVPLLHNPEWVLFKQGKRLKLDDEGQWQPTPADERAERLESSEGAGSPSPAQLVTRGASNLREADEEGSGMTFEFVEAMARSGMYPGFNFKHADGMHFEVPEGR